MNNQVLEMLGKSTYTISDKKYVYVTVAKEPMFSNHFMVSKDSDEITVVTEESNLVELDVLKRNENLWRLVSLNMSVPFTAGTLATINSACAKRNLNNLIISTYSKDYIIVKDSHVDQIKEVLESLGVKQKPLI